jgi:hypothetical protein
MAQNCQSTVRVAQEKKQLSLKTNLVISAIAASVAEIITLPICTTKTNYQNTNSNSIISTLKDIHNKSGIRGFYRASIPAITGQAFATSSKYALYRYFGSIEGKYADKYYVKMANGLFAGIISSFLLIL